MPERQEPLLLRFLDAVQHALERPVEIFRAKIVEPNQKKYPWYHRKYRRVPTIDECYDDDIVCIFEAQAQYMRDRAVDSAIVNILKERHEGCIMWNIEDPHLCDHLDQYVQEAATNWNIKHADLGAKPHVAEAFMKQKHRLVWERRHGPVGSGMKNPDGTKMEL